MATTPATWGPANQFLGKVWGNEGVSGCCVRSPLVVHRCGFRFEITA